MNEQLSKADKEAVTHNVSSVRIGEPRVKKVFRHRHRSIGKNLKRARQLSSRIVHINIRNPENKQKQANKFIHRTETNSFEVRFYLKFLYISIFFFYFTQISSSLNNGYRQTSLNQNSFTKSNNMTHSLQEIHISSKQSSLFEVRFLIYLFRMCYFLKLIHSKIRICFAFRQVIILGLIMKSV